MPPKTPEQYVDSIVDHPAIAPHINTVAKTYELAHIRSRRARSCHQQSGPAAWTRRPRR